jgi:hypothetical protein
MPPLTTDYCGGEGALCTGVWCVVCGVVCSEALQVGRLRSCRKS